VKLGKNAGDTCVMLCEVYGEAAMKKSNVFERHGRFKEGSHIEMRNEHRAQHFFFLVSRIFFTLNSFHKAKQSTKLTVWKYRSGYV